MLSYSANDDMFKKLGKRYGKSTSYADKAIKGFRAVVEIGQHPMALSKLSEGDKAMFRSHSDAWSDIRQSTVWAFLGPEHFEPEEKARRSGTRGPWLFRNCAKALLGHCSNVLTFESGTNDEATLGSSSRNSRNNC